MIFESKLSLNEYFSNNIWDKKQGEKISKSLLKQVSGNVLRNYHDMESRFLKWCEMNTWYSHQLSTLQLVHFQEKFEGNSPQNFQHHILKQFLQMFGNQVP